MRAQRANSVDRIESQAQAPLLKCQNRMKSSRKTKK